MGSHPHQADEVHVVLRGRAGLQVEDAQLEVGAGSIVSVDRGVDHHVVDITDDLRVLMIFAPPETPDDCTVPQITGTPIPHA